MDEEDGRAFKVSRAFFCNFMVSIEETKLKNRSKRMIKRLTVLRFRGHHAVVFRLRRRDVIDTFLRSVLCERAKFEIYAIRVGNYVFHAERNQD